MVVQQELEADSQLVDKEKTSEGGQHDDMSLGPRRSTRQVRRSARRIAEDEHLGICEPTRSTEGSLNNASASSSRDDKMCMGVVAEVNGDGGDAEKPVARPKRSVTSRKGRGKRVAAESEGDEDEQKGKDAELGNGERQGSSSKTRKSTRTARKESSQIKKGQGGTGEDGATARKKQESTQAKPKAYDLETVHISVKSPLVNLDILVRRLFTRPPNLGSFPLCNNSLVSPTS